VRVVSGTPPSIHLTQLDNRGDGEPGDIRLARTAGLTRGQFEEAVRCLDRICFWSEQTHLDPQEGVVTDPAEMLVEGARGGQYRVIRRSSPIPRAYWELYHHLIRASGVDAERLRPKM
jgi:hypothetical protein